MTGSGQVAAIESYVPDPRGRGLGVGPPRWNIIRMNLDIRKLWVAGFRFSKNPGGWRVFNVTIVNETISWETA